MKTPWRFIRNFSGGGNFVDMGTHTVDMIDYLLGAIKDVKTYKSNQQGLYKVEDTMVINFLSPTKILIIFTGYFQSKLIYAVWLLNNALILKI